MRNGLNVFLVVIFTGTTSFFFMKTNIEKPPFPSTFIKDGYCLGPMEERPRKTRNESNTSKYIKIQ